VINIKKFKEIPKFSSDYGDVSFMLIDKENFKDSELFECFEKLAENAEYKPLYYFFYIEMNKYKNYNDIKLPAVVVS
jgi:hypothetical protein